MLLLGALCSGRATADEIPTPEETIVAGEAPLPPAGESIAEEVEGDLLEGWQLELVPYLWIAATSGRVSIGERSAGFDVTVDGIFSAVRTTEPIGRRPTRWRSTRTSTAPTSRSRCR